MPNIRLLNIVFFTAVASSIVHYTDNYLAFDRFPNDGPGPDVTADSIWIAWVVLTAFGVAGYVLYRRGQVRRGSALLAVYSISGLIGLGHYTASGHERARVVAARAHLGRHPLRRRGARVRGLVRDPERRTGRAKFKRLNARLTQGKKPV